MHCRLTTTILFILNITIQKKGQNSYKIVDLEIHFHIYYLNICITIHFVLRNV